jgi:hypothetical protein
MLTKLELLNITETIDKAGISFSHLRNELIDHVCCEIEYQLDRGIDFHNAFENIKSKIGIRELQKVQENTLLLIDKKYRIMKRVMKVSGVLSLIFLIGGNLGRLGHISGSNILMGLGFLLLCFVFLPCAISLMRKENKSKDTISLYLFAYLGFIGFSLGIYFKLMHWPGASILLSLGLLILPLVFLPLLWFSLKKSMISKIEKTSVLIGIIGGAIFLLGLLCKLQHWPGATILFIISVMALTFVFLPVYTYYKFHSQTYVNERYIYIIFSFTWFIFLTILVQLNIGFDVMKVFENDATARFSSIQFNQLQIQKNSLKNKYFLSPLQIIFVKKKIGITDSIIENTKKELIAITNPEDAYDKKDITKAIQCLRDNDSYKECNSILFDGNNPAHQIALNIKAIREYFLLNSISHDRSVLVTVLLDTSLNNDLNGTLWEDYFFKNKSPLAQYYALLYLQERLSIAEKEMTNNLN